MRARDSVCGKSISHTHAETTTLSENSWQLNGGRVVMFKTAASGPVADDRRFRPPRFVYGQVNRFNAFPVVETKHCSYPEALAVSHLPSPSSETQKMGGWEN